MLRGRHIALAVLGIALGAVVGCDRSHPGSPAASSPQAAQLPAGLILQAEPAGAENISAVRQTATDGQSVVIRGRVGGSEKPLAPNRAIITLIDLALPTCDKSPMETCKTPWDACCEPADKIAASSVTVQVVDAQGNPLKGGLEGISGIAPMKELTVTGVAHRPGDGKTLVITASGIHVKGS